MRDDWNQTNLGEICHLEKGTSPTLKTPPGEYPLIVTGPEPLTSDSYQFEGEAVCVPMVSSTGHGHASLKRIHYATGRFAVANIVTACTVREPDVVSTKWLWLYLQHYKDELIVPRMKGTANVSLSQRALSSVPVTIPPLVEQRRIVDLIGTIDDTIAARDGVNTKVRRLLDSLSDALPGETEELDRLLLAIEGGRSPAGVERQPDSGERAVLKVSAIGPNGFEPTEVKVVAADVYLPPRSVVSRGDVLMVRANGVLSRVGVVCWVPEDYPQLHLCDKTLRLVPNPSLLNPTWMAAALSSSDARKQIESLTTGSHMRNIGQTAIRKVRIPAPSLSVQEEYAKLIATLNKNLELGAETLRQLRGVRSELLAVLLSGEQEIPERYDELIEEVA